jgi:ribonucleoside-diphosphate reductase alpha chain
MSEKIIDEFVTDLHDVDTTLLLSKYELYRKEEMSIIETITLFAEICEELLINHKDYDILSVRLMHYLATIRNEEKNLPTFTSRQLYLAEHTGEFMNSHYIDFIRIFRDEIDEIDATYNSIPKFMTIFGYMTFLGSYVLKVGSDIIENPLDVFLRCAIGINFDADEDHDVKMTRIRKSMRLSHEGKCTHATPTLFNAGTRNGQLSSCFVIGMDDSIVGIYDTLKHAALISQSCGGIGMSVTNVRSAGSRIASSNGESSGIIQMLRVFSTTANYVNQGGRGSKRKGAIATFLQPWHADIVKFIESRLANGNEDSLLRDLFLGMWIPDLFMKQLANDGDWYLFCPKDCPDLNDLYGDEFETRYQEYVDMGVYKSKVKASFIFGLIHQTIKESGQPYMMFKDRINKCTNQSNIGTIRCSNLCCEITEVSGPETHAVCNLASIAVNRFYNKETGGIDHDGIVDVARHLTQNLNNCINSTNYPTEPSKRTNLDTRPIGIGIQGVANLLMDMRIPYESEQALIIEAQVMESIYYGALKESMEIAKRTQPYARFEGSPFSKGILQFDMDYKLITPLRHGWTELRRDIQEFGTANSLTTAPMPTASTSQLLGNYECFEPITSNCFLRKTSYGSFKCINYNLIDDLKQLDLWNISMKNKIISEKGSIQDIPNIPKELKDLYRTVWEMKQKWIMDHAIARSPFVDQSQSMNLYFSEVKYDKFKAAMLYAWRNGLKTGSYYTRSRALHDTTDKISEASEDNKPTSGKTVECKDDVCVMCSA